MCANGEGVFSFGRYQWCGNTGSYDAHNARGLRNEEDQLTGVQTELLPVLRLMLQCLKSYKVMQLR